MVPRSIGTGTALPLSYIGVIGAPPATRSNVVLLLIGWRALGDVFFCVPRLQYKEVVHKPACSFSCIYM